MFWVATLLSGQNQHQFAWGFTLPMCQNSCWATSKRVTHLEFIFEIILGVNGN
jgi:hypothetical protein